MIKDFHAGEPIKAGDLVCLKPVRRKWWAFWKPLYEERIFKVRSISDRIDGVWMPRT